MTLGLVYKVLHTQHTSLTKLDFSAIPYTVGDWKGEDLAVTPDVTEILGTEDVLMRLYKKTENAPSILLAIVYSDNNRDTFHPPELCYVGSGLELQNKKSISLSLGENQTLDANELLLKNSNKSLKAWYWFAVGNRFVATYYHQQAYFFLDALQGKPLRGALIRVSMQGKTEPDAQIVSAFITKLMPDLKQLFKVGNTIQ